MASNDRGDGSHYDIINPPWGEDRLFASLAACRTRVSGLVRGVKVPVAEPSI